MGFVWDPRSEQWEQQISELAIFTDEHNHCRVPATYKTASGFTLGSWVSQQRTAYSKDQLTPERIQRLDELGFAWDPLTEKWKQGFNELAIFKDENNHSRIPGGYKTASGFTLGSWVSRQRAGKDQLTSAQIQRLDDELGFVWDPLTEQWEQGFRELAKFKDANSHCRVPKGYKTASGFSLGRWVGSQRMKKDQLIPERIQRLDELGFVWGVLSEQWEQGFSELTIYKDENNHCRVPSIYKTGSGYALGTWVGYLRSNKDQLTQERIQRLDELGFVWTVKKFKDG